MMLTVRTSLPNPDFQDSDSGKLRGLVIHIVEDFPSSQENKLFDSMRSYGSNSVKQMIISSTVKPKAIFYSDESWFFTSTKKVKY